MKLASMSIRSSAADTWVAAFQPDDMVPAISSRTSIDALLAATNGISTVALTAAYEGGQGGRARSQLSTFDSRSTPQLRRAAWLADARRCSPRT